MNTKKKLEMKEDYDYPIDIFYANRKEGHSSFMFKTSLELLQKPETVDCHDTCLKCTGPSEYSCSDCNSRKHRQLNRATGECFCKGGYKENTKTGNCDIFTFSSITYDAYTMSKIMCYDICEKKYAKSQDIEFVLKITTKEGAAPSLM